MKFFQGCTALITGASSGLGEEFARQLAPYASTLVLVARRIERLDALKNELESLHPGVRVAVYKADLSQDEEIVRFVEWLRKEKLPINFLINNAGLGDHGKFETSDWDRVKAMLDVNIRALTRLTHLLLPDMRKGGRAAILNVSSAASFVPLPNSAVYAATKAYVTSFSEALRIELRETGISVTALCPGPVETEFFQVATRPGQEPWTATRDAPCSLHVTPAEAVRAGLEAVARDRARIIPGFLMCVAITAATLVPFFIVRRILECRMHAQD